MRGRARRIAAILAPTVLAVLCAAAFIFRPVEFCSSLYDLAGPSTEVIPAVVRSHGARLIPVLVSSPDASAARKAADRLYALIPSNACSSVRYRFDDEALAHTLEMCRVYRAGLASPRDVQLLKTPEGRARIARAAARRYYSSPVPPLFRPAEDPFCLVDGFVASLPSSCSGWMPKHGVLTAERDGRTSILLVIELSAAVAGDPSALAGFALALDAAIASAAEGVEIEACGVPLHTARTAARCKAEIGGLTWFSLFFIAALSLVVFRSVRWIPFLGASLAVAAAAGGLALWGFFPAVHVIAVVFGTTVLGLVIDYSFHWLLQRSSNRRETVRNLIVSCATTEISLLPLMFSSLPVLRQSAVFLGAGLAASLIYVLFCYPRPKALQLVRQPLQRLPFAKPVLAMLAVAAGMGWLKISFQTDPAAIYRPTAELAAAEKKFAELSGAADSSRGFLVTEGCAELEPLLEREEAADLPQGTPCLSHFMPSLSRRRAVASDIAKLYAEHGKRQCGLLSLPSLQAPPEPAAWRWEDVPQAASAAFVSDGKLIVSSAPQPQGPLPPGVRFCRPRQMLGEILAQWSAETRLRLAVALALMFAALVAVFRVRALAIFIPSLGAIAVVLGMLSLCGNPVTLFHLLACFLLAGMGVDYTVFLHAGGKPALKPAFCALLTSVAGFGALAFVSFPVVTAFGTVLGAGLPLAFLIACATAPQERSATEHGASPLGLLILFSLYRVFGLHVLHAGASCVGWTVWCFSRAVRRASPSPRKAVLFAQSLADKLVVMAQGRSLPHVEADSSADARDFLADVAARRGVFVLSSHCGTIEVLAALGECDATFHAWMEMARTSVFNSFYMKRARRGKVVIHPIAEFGPETVFKAGDALDAGDCLVMAGDRGFGRMRRVPFRNGEIALPEGAFRFARALGHPVYFVACVATGACRYRAIVRHLPAENADAMASAYADALDEVTRTYPEQWFKWEGE